MPNDNDNKLVTLEDLGEAYNALYARDVMDASDKTKLDGIEAGAQVNTVTSVNNQTGAVSITPANIGAPNTTGLGASGIWNINIPFSGSGTTGFKSFTINEINIDDTHGSWVAGFYDRTNHGTFPSWNIWWTIVRQYETAGFLYQFANQLDNNGLSAYMSFRAKWENGSWGPWTDLVNNKAVPVTSGGTGATTAAVTITNDYSSVLNAINAVRGTRIFPISIQKNGSASYTDVPSGLETSEWNLLLFGDNERITAILHIFPMSSVYLRSVAFGTWFDSWTQLH